MNARVTVVTLGVDDLERSVRFYRDGLGLRAHDVGGTAFERREVAFFDLQAGLRLALRPRESIAHDAGMPVGPPSPTELTLGYGGSSAAEVDQVLEHASRAGSRIVKQARGHVLGGYAGYFEDPDRHLWMVVRNPEPETGE